MPNAARKPLSSVSALTARTPEKAALIANTIVDVYLEEQASNRSDTAKRTSGELGVRVLKICKAKSKRPKTRSKPSNRKTI